MKTGEHLWWVEALLGLGLLFAAQFLARRIIQLIRKKEVGSSSWRNRVAYIIQPPVTLILWVTGIVYVVEIVGQKFGFSISLAYMHSFRNALIVGSVAWLVLRWASELQQSLLADGSKKLDVTTVQMIGKLSTVCIIFVTGLTVMQLFGFNIAPLLALGTIGGASLGFGGKDIIANFCSGIMLHMTRPFIMGDLVYLPEKNLEGIVEEIGWFRSLIRDKEKRAVYLPNNFFSTLLVVNISRMSHRRIKQILRFPFGIPEKIPGVAEKIKKMIASNPKIDLTMPIHVYLHEIGEYSCNLEIEAFSKEIDFEKFNHIQQEILLSVQSILRTADIQLAVHQIQLISPLT